LPYLCFVDAVLVPLKFESGTRFKILEAGAVGQAVISTTLGAEGIDVTDGRDIILADDLGAFAAAIVRVLKDPTLGKSLGRGLRELVSRKYSLETLERQARDVLSYLSDFPKMSSST
jgi:glycosyltransferase involved in cell wall biosynthesis